MRTILLNPGPVTLSARVRAALAAPAAEVEPAPRNVPPSPPRSTRAAKRGGSGTRASTD